MRLYVCATQSIANAGGRSISQDGAGSQSSAHQCGGRRDGLAHGNTQRRGGYSLLCHRLQVISIEGAGALARGAAAPASTISGAGDARMRASCQSFLGTLSSASRASLVCGVRWFPGYLPILWRPRPPLALRRRPQAPAHFPYSVGGWARSVGCQGAVVWHTSHSNRRFNQITPRPGVPAAAPASASSQESHPRPQPARPALTRNCAGTSVLGSTETGCLHLTISLDVASRHHRAKPPSSPPFVTDAGSHGPRTASARQGSTHDPPAPPAPIH